MWTFLGKGSLREVSEVRDPFLVQETPCGESSGVRGRGSTGREESVPGSGHFWGSRGKGRVSDSEGLYAETSVET